MVHYFVKPPIIFLLISLLYGCGLKLQSTMPVPNELQRYTHFQPVILKVFSHLSY
jgi:outer membrane lipopolysaccharide assembly protein LptE/RlpB